MYEIRIKKQFQKDLKRVAKRGNNIDKLETIIGHLQKGQELERKHKSHQLKGIWKPCWECHIVPDWLLIWDYSDDGRDLILVRTGSHSDLFE
jgi:mRNA interferase YafQ